MTPAELTLKMCPMNLNCHRCSFNVPQLGKNECHVADRAHMQKSVQKMNNPQQIKRQWTLAGDIHIAKRR